MSDRLPSKDENPKGLHRRYRVLKEDGTTATGTYLVLRIDNDGDDQEWQAACRQAAYKLVKEIQDRRIKHLQKFANELHELVTDFCIESN